MFTGFRKTAKNFDIPQQQDTDAHRLPDSGMPRHAFLEIFQGTFNTLLSIVRRFRQPPVEKKPPTPAKAARGIWVLLDSSFRFAEVSPEFCNLLGFSRSELIGRGAEDVTPPDFANIRAVIEQIRLAGKKTGLWIYRRCDGRLVLVRYKVQMRADQQADLYIDPVSVPTESPAAIY